MPGTMEIIDAISALVVKAIPELKQTHVDLLPSPEDFKRPSVLLEAKGREELDAAARMVEVEEQISIAVFDETDDYSNSSAVRLLELQRKVLAVFADGFVRVGDRALKVTASNGGRDWDVAFADVTFHFFDERGAAPAEPAMGAVHTEMKVKG